jgi:two-component system response regulator
MNDKAGTQDRPVILIEDNADDEALTLRALKKANVLNEVLVARDGAEALEVVFGQASTDLSYPALILLDLKLPKIDGLEVLRRIRADERTELIPVVILTSSREQEDIIGGYKSGANGYVRKPVKFSEFADTVASLGMFWLLLNEPMPRISKSSDLGDGNR